MFIIVSWLLFNYEGYSAAMDVLLSGFIILNAAVSLYGRMYGNLILIAALFYIAVALESGISAALVLQPIALGAISSPRLYRKTASNTAEHRKSTENIRNAFQIIAGIAFMVLFLFVQQYAQLILAIALLAGMAVGNVLISSKGRILGVLSRMEREGHDFGHGAFWLGVGAVFAAGFLGFDAAVVVFSAIFIADSLSTIAGVHYGKAKLPYNRKKSIIGTAVYFVAVLAVSFPIISYAALPIALMAAFVESLPLHIDDNFSVSVVLTAALRIVLYLA